MLWFIWVGIGIPFLSEKSNEDELSGRQLAETYPGGTCNTQHFKCIKNPQHLIVSLKANTL